MDGHCHLCPRIMPLPYGSRRFRFLVVRGKRRRRTTVEPMRCVPRNEASAMSLGRFFQSQLAVFSAKQTACKPASFVIQHHFSQSYEQPSVCALSNLNVWQVSGATNEPGNGCFVGGTRPRNCSRAGPLNIIDNLEYALSAFSFRNMAFKELSGTPNRNNGAAKLANHPCVARDCIRAYSARFIQPPIGCKPFHCLDLVEIGINFSQA